MTTHRTTADGGGGGEVSTTIYADVHSALCHAAHVPHGHGIACHSTCPTCSGRPYALPESTSGEAS